MAPESLYQGVYTTKSDVWVHDSRSVDKGTIDERFYWINLKILVAVKITEAYNSEAPKFPLFVCNNAGVFSCPIRS